MAIGVFIRKKYRFSQLIEPFGRILLRRDMSAASFGTPLIALTENANPDSRTEYIKTGFNDYMSKPVSEKNLNAILSRLLLDRS